MCCKCSRSTDTQTEIISPSFILKTTKWQHSALFVCMNMNNGIANTIPHMKTEHHGIANTIPHMKTEHHGIANTIPHMKTEHHGIANTIPHMKTEHHGIANT